MTDEKDPFSMLSEEEGMSPIAKFCVSAAVVLLILVLYLNGSGTAEKYKKPPVAENFSIEGLESQELSFEELDEYNENKKKAKEQKEKEENAPPVVAEEEAKAKPAAPDTSSVLQENQPVPSVVEKDASATIAQPDVIATPASSSPQTQINEVAPASPTVPVPAPVPVPAAVPEPPAPAPVIEEVETISYDNIRQPIPAKGNWRNKLPDFATLTEAQRLTPIDNLEYSPKFNDSVGAITISPELGKPWYYFRRLHTAKKANAAKIAVVMYGLGINSRNTAKAINSLPAEVTMSFSVYTENLVNEVLNARKAGHETMLDIPLQSEDYPLIDPGSLGMLQNVTPGDNMTKLIKILSQDIPFIGFYSMNGEAMSVSVPSMTALSNELVNRGLVLLDGNKKSIISEFKKLGPLKTTVVIDGNMFKEQIIDALERVKKEAIKNGSAILAIDPQLLSIYLLRDFINEDITPDPNIELVPASLLFNP